jgi:hypothetical protein
MLHVGLLRFLVSLLPFLHLPCLAFDSALHHPRNIGDDLARGPLVRVHIGHFHDLPVLVRSTIVDPIDPALVQQDDWKSPRNNQSAKHCRGCIATRLRRTEDSVVTETSQTMHYPRGKVTSASPSQARPIRLSGLTPRHRDDH